MSRGAPAADGQTARGRGAKRPGYQEKYREAAPSTAPTLVIAERHAEGLENDQALHEVAIRAWEFLRTSTPHTAPYSAAVAAIGLCGQSAWTAAWHIVGDTRRAVRLAGGRSSSEARVQAALLREVFGNPFRPLPSAPTAIRPLAEEIYAGRWERMPILGEYLQANGYWDEGQHCLDPRITHVRGCHVSDWLTGRS